MNRLARFARALGLCLVALVLLAGCDDRRLVSPKTANVSVGDGLDLASAQMPSVRISEFHYDNGTTDVEKVEISGPAGTSLSGWTLVLYNGNASSRAAYNTQNLGALTIDASCGNRGVAVFTYTTNNSIQDGSGVVGGTDPDGIALVNGSTVVDLIAYEGTFVAASGVAVDRTFPDIGVREESSTPSTQSLKRTANNVWTGPSANDFGTCNDVVPPTPAPVDRLEVTPTATSVRVGQTQQYTGTAYDAGNAVVPETPVSWQSSDPLVASIDGNGLVTAFGTGDVTVTGTTPNGKTATATLHIDPSGIPALRFTEVHYNSSIGDQKIEVEGPVGTDFGDPDIPSGWGIALYDGDGGKMYDFFSLAGALGGDCDAGTRGVTAINPTPVFQKGAPDGMALIEPATAGRPYPVVHDFISYRGSFTATDGPAQGKRSINIGTETVLPSGSMQRLRDGSVWYGPVVNTIGACNVDPIPPPQYQIEFSGRGPSDPNLPVGFEDQLFAVERNQGTGEIIPTTITWNAETPTIAVIDSRGVVHAYAVGTATFRATATDGSTATWSLSISNPAVSATANWNGNLEFGMPVGQNDNVLTRNQFVASVNQNRGIPNWVSAKLEVSHFGNSEDLCDCYAYDESLPVNNPLRYTTADYPSPSGTPGTYERGKLLRSADLTITDGDNKFAYLFSNIVPMTPAVMNGAWADLEGYLGTLARTGKVVYMVAGATGSLGTIGSGKITVPQYVWKAALILPQGKGLADVQSAADVQAVAAIMPNNSGVGSTWNAYSTTIDAVEALSGYDLFSLLENQIELQVESNSRPPVAVSDGPYVSNEGSAVTMSAAASSDPDGDALTAYDWDFGDGSTGTGVSVSHVYAQQGAYTVTLTVTESHGIINTTTTTATVANVAPAVSSIAGATLNPGDTFTASGSFADPGADAWSATVDYGDGGGASALSLSGNTFSLSHTYATTGTFTVTVSVNDGTASGTATATVVVRARPVASINGPFSSSEGSAVAISGAASSDADGTIQSYAWNFGDGTSGTGATASHTYAQDGSYTVTLTVTDNDGLTGTATTTATVANIAPVVSAFADATITVGDTYSASGSFTDPGADSWSATVDYGDGSSGPLTLSGKSFTLSHTYASMGTFTVTVAVSDGAASGSKSQTVRVRARPVAALNGPYTSNEGSAVSMSAAASSDPDGIIASYAWNFGDGTSGSGAAVSHTYAQQGSYTVSLTVTDNDGLSASTSSTATVANVAPVVGAFADATLFLGDSYTANSSFSDPGADTWSATVDYGDGSGTGALPLSGKAFALNHLYTTLGTFTVTVTVSDGTDAVSRTASVRVRARPIASINGPFSLAEGSTVSMSGAASRDPDGTIQSYAWSFGDGTTGTGVNVSHTYPRDGLYTVTLTVTDNEGLTGVVSTQAAVSNVLPVLSVLEDVRLEAGDVYAASGSFTDPGDDSWSATVDYGDGTSGPLALSGKSYSLSHQYVRAGNYTVVVSVSDGTGAGTQTARVNVRGRPIANVTGSLAGPEGSALSLSGATSTDDGTIVSYDWSFGDGSTGTGVNVSHTYAQDGVYTVTLSVTDNEGLVGVKSVTAQIANVAPAIVTLPNAAILQGEAYVMPGSFTDPGADNPWRGTVFYGEGATNVLALNSKAFTLSHTYLGSGTFTVLVQVTDDDVTSVRTATVSVMSVTQAMNYVLSQIDTPTLLQRMEQAIKQYLKNPKSNSSTIAQLNGFLDELGRAVSRGDMTAAEAQPLQELIQRVIASLTTLATTPAITTQKLPGRTTIKTPVNRTAPSILRAISPRK